MVTWNENNTPVLSSERIEDLQSYERLLGPWKRYFADDIEMLDYTIYDINMMMRYAHPEDTSWITRDVLATYIAHHGSTATVSTGDQS